MRDIDGRYVPTNLAAGAAALAYLAIPAVAVVLFVAWFLGGLS